MEDGYADWCGPDYGVEQRNQLGSVLRDRRGSRGSAGFTRSVRVQVGRTLCRRRGAL